MARYNLPSQVRELIRNNVVTLKDRTITENELLSNLRDITRDHSVAWQDILEYAQGVQRSFVEATRVVIYCGLDIYCAPVFHVTGGGEAKPLPVIGMFFSNGAGMVELDPKWTGVQQDHLHDKIREGLDYMGLLDATIIHGPQNGENQTYIIDMG